MVQQLTSLRAIHSIGARRGTMLVDCCGTRRAGAVNTLQCAPATAPEEHHQARAYTTANKVREGAGGSRTQEWRCCKHQLKTKRGRERKGERDANGNRNAVDSGELWSSNQLALQRLAAKLHHSSLLLSMSWHNPTTKAKHRSDKIDKIDKSDNNLNIR
jgi:hypothetical protein